jgi:hypothetical protein
LWRAGDLHAHRVTFTLLESGQAPYTVSVGQYDGTRGENAIFILPDGTYTPLIELP